MFEPQRHKVHEVFNKFLCISLRPLHLCVKSFGFFLLSFILTACNGGSSPNVTYVIVTGQPTQIVSVQDNVVGQQSQVVQSTALAPLTITPIPPTATPDVAPDVALQVGDRYLQDGYYENAVFSYQAILARDDAPPEIRAAAAYHLGEAALREGLFSEAVSALTTLMNTYPNDFRTAQAFFLRGDAYLGSSEWALAIADFQQYLVLRPGIIDSYAYERIGDAQLALGLLPDALTSYGQASNANRSLVPQLALREKVAQVYLTGGQVDQALAQYDAILQIAENTPYRADIEFRAASMLLDAGNTDLALARLERIFAEYPTRSQAYDAMSLLLENGRTLDAYARGRVNYFYGDYPGAIEAFNQYTSEVSLAEIPAELQLLLGRAYRELGNPEAAQVAFQTIVEQYPDDRLFGEALLEQGRTYFLSGEITAAIDRYLAIATNYGYLPEVAAEALWRAGYLHSTNDRPTEGRAIFQQLAQTFPDSSQARSGLSIAASAAINSGDDAAAESLFGQLAATSTGTEAADAYLQLGRLALKRGQQSLAQESFNQAIAAAPDSYYSARAGDLVIGRAPFTPPTRYIFTFDELADITTAEDWLRTTFGLTQASPLWPLAPEIEADSRIVRGRELWAVGAFKDAETEFFDVLDAYEENGLVSYQLAIFYRTLGAFLPSMQGAANVITAANVTTLDAPAYIARMRYPTYYRDLVLNVAQEREMDPLLIFSLIRHESLFNTNATAAAGEKGLTQVIPDTAAYIADELDWPDYQHSDLFRPYAGIEFGAFFLEENLDRFDNNVYAGLAGYNAGPGRAISWLELSGGDPDLFMSTITIETTQVYIQRIYSHYSIYRALYGADS